MKRLIALAILTIGSGTASSQDALADRIIQTPASPGIPLETLVDGQPSARSPLQSNRDFPDFIGFMTNPLQAIDPRSLTQIQPIFLGSWWNPSGSLPGGNAQVVTLQPSELVLRFPAGCRESRA